MKSISIVTMMNRKKQIIIKLEKEVRLMTIKKSKFPEKYMEIKTYKIIKIWLLEKENSSRRT